MNLVKVFRTLGPIDARNVRRDALLRWMVALPLVIALFIRLAVPVLVDRLTFFDLQPYYLLVVSYFFITMTPILYGVVIGFLLLDERDDRTLVALQVTPLSLGRYFVYRIAVPMILSVVMSIGAYYLANLVPIGLGALLIVALLAAPQAPIFALFFASFAANKVQGFALMKGLGVVLIAPLIAYFVAWPWQLLFGLLPTYWPVKLFWVLEANQGGGWLWFAAGLAYQLVLLGWLLRRLVRVMHQ